MVAEKNKRNELFTICMLISEYHNELAKEFNKIEELLNVAASYGMAYMEQETALNHFKYSMKNCKTAHIKLLLREIKKIGENAYCEFTRGMDFCDMYNAIIKEMHSSNFITKIWDMKKELKYVIHSIHRIAKEKNEEKKIAILKGMLAYY